MANPLATVVVPHSRVSVPRRIDAALDRPRLLAGTRGPAACAPDVLLACAPAGYGKTTMLTRFAEEQRDLGMPVAWVTCDRDDDTRTFWSAVVAATADAAADAAEAAGVTASALELLGSPVGRVDASFVGTLVDSLRSEVPGLVLVLDDAHEVTGRPLLDGIEHLVEWADGDLRVALGCRFEPPVGLHRARLTGRMHEVRAAELAFTAAEADAFWTSHDLVLEPAIRSALLALTEGWPAALRLAALALEGGDDPARFVEEFSGADRPVADYLAGEILVRLDPDDVGFLLRTSVVEELHVDLAARLSGRQDAAEVLEDLTDRHALVTRIDRGGTSFRYHSLLRTHLAAAMRRRSPAETARLHGIAAHWLLEHDRGSAALDQATATGDPALVDAVLGQVGLSLLLAGSADAVRRAVTGSGAASPTVLTHRALLAVDDGDVVGADESLAALARLPDDGADRRLTSLRRAAALHRARLASDLADAHSSALVADVGVAHLPPDLDPDVRLLVLADRGALRLFEGDHGGAREDLCRAVTLAGAADLPSVQLYCKNLIAGTFLVENDIDEGARAAQRAISFASARGWQRSAGMTYSYGVAAWTAFERLRPDEAATWAALAVDVLDATTIDAQVEGLARTSEAIIAFDDPHERRAALGRLDRATTWLDTRTASPALTALAAPHELRMCLTLGEWQRGEAAVARAERRLGSGADVTVLHAQLAAARGRSADARRLLAPVLSGVVAPLRSTALTTAWLLEAVLAQRADRQPAVTEALLTALRLAAPAGAARPFFDAGPDVHAALATMRGRAGADEEFLDTVRGGIAAILARQSASFADAGPGAAPSGTPRGGWLPERELLVLRELPSMMTLGEIATAHGISLNTVKTHVRSIYAKLGAGTRRQAIAIARGLGLI